MRINLKRTGRRPATGEYEVESFIVQELDDEKAEELGSKIAEDGKYMILVGYDAELTVFPSAECEIQWCVAY